VVSSSRFEVRQRVLPDRRRAVLLGPEEEDGDVVREVRTRLPRAEGEHRLDRRVERRGDLGTATAHRPAPHRDSIGVEPTEERRFGPLVLRPQRDHPVHERGTAGVGIVPEPVRPDGHHHESMRGEERSPPRHASFRGHEPGDQHHAGRARGRRERLDTVLRHLPARAVPKSIPFPHPLDIERAGRPGRLDSRLEGRRRWRLVVPDGDRHREPADDQEGKQNSNRCHDAGAPVR